MSNEELQSLEDSLLNSNIPITEELGVVELEGKQHIIPIALAAKLKNVSVSAINYAISRGDLVKVNGVTLESLEEYKVDKQKKLSGIVGAIAKKTVEEANNIK